MATPTDTHAEPVNNETPSQGIFMGWLALALLVFALAVAGFAIYAGASHGTPRTCPGSSGRKPCTIPAAGTRCSPSGRRLIFASTSKSTTL